MVSSRGELFRRRRTDETMAKKSQTISAGCSAGSEFRSDALRGPPPPGAARQAMKLKAAF
jgi:hypothetical protein